MDLGFLTGLAAFSGCVWMLGPSLVAPIAQAMRSSLAAAPGVLASPNEILAVTGAVLVTAARPLALVGGAVFLVVLVFEIAQTGVIFSTEPLRPDFNRLNPANGLKRVFSIRMLVETGKNVLKMAVYGTLAWMALKTAAGEGAATVWDGRGLVKAMVRAMSGLLALFLGAAVVFAALDQFIVRRDFTKRMRMSRREVRRETRDREGDARMKQRRKQLHGEFAKLSESLRNIRGADLLIVNPTHYAVALRYDPLRMDAPVVVSRGAHQVAQRLKRLAFLYNVVIVQDAPLARALYRCALHQAVPEALYQPVADLYRAMRRQQAARPATDRPDV